MGDLFLSKRKTNLLDLAIGEPYLMQSCIKQALDLDILVNYHDSDWEYPDPVGYLSLIEFLEEEHQAPIVITNGAKQALSAVFYAMQKRDRHQLLTRTPYWALLPSLAAFHQLDFQALPWEHCFPHKDHGFLLLVAPNNPDNWLPEQEEMSLLLDELRDRKVPVVHDAAYYTQGYVRKDQPLFNMGDLQIFSASKMLGMPGMRVGYIVCHDTSYYQDLVAYQELTTVGVSEASQRFVFDILSFFKNNFQYWSWCQDHHYNLLAQNRSYLTQLDPRVMMGGSEQYPSMFAWMTKGPDFEKTKSEFHVAEGISFGNRHKIRINLSIAPETFQSVFSKFI